MMEDHALFSPKDLISASWTAKIHLKNFILLLILFYFIFFQSISTSQNNICQLCQKPIPKQYIGIKVYQIHQTKGKKTILMIKY